MKKKITAFALCLALMTMMLEPISLAEEPTSTPAETQTVAPEKPEVTEAPTAEPAVEEETAAPTTEPMSEPENTAAPTAEPTSEPENTAAPTAVPEGTPEAEPTTTPTEAPTEEPSVEPSVEPSIEPTEEPIWDPLTAKLAAQTQYAVAGQKAIEAQLSIAGGAAPYAVRVCVVLDGGIVHEENAALSEAGTLNIRYMPEAYGRHEVRVTVVDSMENHTETTVGLPVAVIEHETRREWEKTLSGVKLGSDWRENILAIAQSQLGYRESQRDFIVDDDGKTQGYSCYGDWYGCPYVDWCSMFCAFVLDYAGIPSYAVPRSASSERLRNEIASQGAYEKRGEYTPQNGDLIFFDWKDEQSGRRDGEADHIGIVERVSGDTVYTIEGNAGREVQRREYDLEDPAILGYANLGVLMERAGLDETEIAEETMDPVAGETNAARVNLRDRASRAGNVICVLEEAGTEVTVQAKATRADGEVWYRVVANGETGYVREDLLELMPMVVDIERQTAESGVSLVCTQVSEDADYRWQRREMDENGGERWTDVGDGALLNLPAEAEALLAWYRCIRTTDGAEIASEAIRPVRDELIEWLEQGTPTSEMIARALNASTLEAITLESDELIYVRTGEVIAHYDPETGLVTDAAMNVPVGRIVDGKLKPLSEEPADAQ